ncbi:Uncharacterized protein DBV15_07600 [Temnothorax longispinosus]|uniref:Uncharacterized protein n=1 Tax=Temnothorax longispinosus TaxID=300112 RepID=A0A4S2L5G5_9HYME|nr:Uncharacterized protein DBV15_07600 [Temnothorax longispinosus]
MAHLPGKYLAKEEDRRRAANSHDVDKVGRWAAARWVPGGSTGVHQGSRRYVRPKEEGGVRRRNNSEGEKEEMRGNLTSCLGLFSHPLGDRSAASEGVERGRKREKESNRTYTGVGESERDGRKEAKRDTATETETEKEKERRRWRQQHSSFYHVGRTGGQLGGDLSFISG